MILDNAKPTKSELKKNKDILERVNRYLPMLKAKKQLLSGFRLSIKSLLENQLEETKKALNEMQKFSSFFRSSIGDGILEKIYSPKVAYRFENIAGIKLSFVDKVNFDFSDFCRYSVQWKVFNAIDSAIHFGKEREKYKALHIAYDLISSELKKVSIRAGLFENILAVRAKNNIIKISGILTDQELISLGQAKFMKRRHESR